MAMKHPLFENVFPIENAYVPFLMYLFVGVTLAMPQWRGGGGDKKTPMSFVISGCWKAVLTETICEAKGAARKLTAGT